MTWKLQGAVCKREADHVCMQVIVVMGLEPPTDSRSEVDARGQCRSSPGAGPLTRAQTRARGAIRALPWRALSQAATTAAASPRPRASQEDAAAAPPLLKEKRKVGRPITYKGDINDPQPDGAGSGRRIKR